MHKLTHVISLVLVEIGVHVSFVIAPDSAGHAWPGLFYSQDTLYVIPSDFSARNRIDNRRLNTEEWQGGTSRFGGSHAS